MKLRVIECFTDKTLNEKRGGVRWEGEVFDAPANRAKVLMAAGKVEEVVDEPEPADGGDQAPAGDPDVGESDE